MKQEREDPRPAHPLVDWNVTETRTSNTSRGLRARIYVKVECPVCHMKRFAESSKVVQQIRWGMFTGRCNAHRRPWQSAWQS